MVPLCIPKQVFCVPKMGITLEHQWIESNNPRF